MPTLRLVHTPFTVPVVEMKINGKTHFFMVDTGAEISLIDPKKVEVNVSSRVPINVCGVGGVVREDAAILRFNLLGKTVNRVALSESLTETSKVFPLSGIIGQDVLRQFSSVEINYREQVVRFNEM